MTAIIKNSKRLRMWENQFSPRVRENVRAFSRQTHENNCEQTNSPNDTEVLKFERIENGSSIFSILVNGKYFVKFICNNGNENGRFVILDLAKSSRFKREEIERRFSA